MKRIFVIFIFLITTVILTTSCLEHNLPDVTESSENTINSVNFQYRYVDTTYIAAGTENADTTISVKLVTLNTATVYSNDTIYCTPTFPSTFPTDQKVYATITHLWGYVTIPDGATIEPIDGAPALGTAGDFSSAVSYRVTAANGDERVYVIVTASLPEVNKYEGYYHSTGYFDHPTSPRSIDLEKYMATVDPVTITGDHSDLGSSGYTITITINTDNSVVVKQFANGSEIGEMVPGAENKYDPGTKTFTLNYRYEGSSGYRTISETLVYDPDYEE